MSGAPQKGPSLALWAVAFGAVVLLNVIGQPSGDLAQDYGTVIGAMLMGAGVGYAVRVWGRNRKPQ